MASIPTNNQAPIYALSSPDRTAPKNPRLVSVNHLGGPYFHVWISDSTTVGQIKQLAAKHFGSEKYLQYSTTTNLITNEKNEIPITADRIHLVYNQSRITDASLRNIPNLDRLFLIVEHPLVSLDRYSREYPT